MKGNISILRNSNNEIMIDIMDNNSRIDIVNLTMDLEEFAMAVTGRDDTTCDITRVVSEDHIKNIGMKHIIQKVYIPKIQGMYDREDIKAYVISSFEKSEYYKDGWMMSNDGTHSQQNEKQHRYVIYKYVDPEAVTEVEL